MKKSFFTGAVAAAVLLGLFGCIPQQDNYIFPQAGTVHIIRDTYGVPHIIAANMEDAVYGLGFATAEDRARQLFTTAMTAAGRLSEIEGREALERDVLIRSFQIRKLAAEKIKGMDEDLVNFYSAFCDGVNTNVAERLDELTLPVLVITGADDRIVPTEQSLRLADALPNATLNVIAASGHLPHEEKSLEFMQAIDEFLNDLET